MANKGSLNKEKLTNSIQMRDFEKQTILDKITIDLPSVKDIESLRNIREKEILDTWLSKNNYSFNNTTDLTTLTGRRDFFNIYYLSDSVEGNEYEITYYEEGKIYSNGANNNQSNRYIRNFIIRPILNFNKCPELFDKLLESRAIDKIDDKYARILLGWMPQNAASIDIQKKLDIELKDKKLMKTNDVYTFDGIYVFDNNVNKKNFKPKEYPIYEYDGKKYIRFKVFQNFGDHGFIERITNVKGEAKYLSNTKSYFNGDSVWLQVSQVSWIVDIERKTFISQEGLLSGIQFENGSERDDKPVNYLTSNIKWYLDNYMKYEMLANDELLFKKAKEINNKKSNEITNLLNKINKYRKYYYGNIDVESEVSKLINDYNEKLDELAHNVGHKSNNLSIEVNNPKVLYQKLILNLNEILRELITNGEKVKSYHDMIEILEECQKEKTDPNKDEICETINNIKTIILEFIINNKIKNKLKEELNKIIIDEINHNKAYIDEFRNNDNVKTKSLDELKIEFKKDIHPYLILLNDVINKQDLVNEIMNNVHIMITNHFTGSKNKIIKNYLAILNDIITRIKENGTEDDLNILENSIHLDYDIAEDTNDILRKIELMIITAYKIELNIQERNNIINEINDLKVNVNFLEDNKTK